MNCTLTLNFRIDVGHPLKPVTPRSKRLVPDPKYLELVVTAGEVLETHANVYIGDPEEVSNTDADATSHARTLIGDLDDVVSDNLPKGVRDWIRDEIKLYLDARARGAIRVRV